MARLQLATIVSFPSMLMTREIRCRGSVLPAVIAAMEDAGRTRTALEDHDAHSFARGERDVGVPVSRHCGSERLLAGWQWRGVTRRHCDALRLHLVVEGIDVRHFHAKFHQGPIAIHAAVENLLARARLRRRHDLDPQALAIAVYPDVAFV